VEAVAEAEAVLAAEFGDGGGSWSANVGDLASSSRGYGVPSSGNLSIGFHAARPLRANAFPLLRSCQRMSLWHAVQG